MIRGLPWVPADASVAAAWEAAGQGARPAVLIGQPGAFAGLVSSAHLRDAIRAARGDLPLLEIATREPAHAHPDHPLDVVLERLAGADGALPVVSRDDAERVEGVITLDALIGVVGARRGGRTVSSA
jgi:CBS domain-containing protein